MGNIADYDIIFLGSPIWSGTIAPPVKTFLSGHDLSGKRIIPFVTHGGGGAGSSFTDMKSWPRVPGSRKVCRSTAAAAGSMVK